jgi:hypothetical protein
MRQSTTEKRTGIQWTFTKQLKDLDFADDIALLFHKHQDAQEKLFKQIRRTGLKINKTKTEIMRVSIISRTNFREGLFRVILDFWGMKSINRML